MVQYFTITIPVKPYIRKYIESRNCLPMIISATNYLGSIIYSVLEKEKAPCIFRNSKEYTDTRYKQLTDVIKVRIPKYLVNSYLIGLSISKDKAILINNLFNNKITEDIYIYCSSYAKAGLKRRQAIEDFCNEHNILLDIDITYWAFKKAEYRHRKELNKSPAKMSPPFYSNQSQLYF